MKNKLSLKLLTRWIAAPLLVASLVAWGVSPAYPKNKSAADVAHAKTADAVSSVIEIGTLAEVQEIKVRMQELESHERQNYALALEGQRKTMDWWFSFLAVLTAIMAILGGLIPYLMARKDKELIEQDKTVIANDKKEIEKDKEQTRALLDEVKNIKSEAAVHLEKTQQSSAEAEKILGKVQSGTSSASGEKVEEAVAQVKQDKVANPLLKLRAEAIDAGKEKNANKAYRLWAALTELTSDDANAQFNAGYWAQKLVTSNPSESSYWLKLAGSHYTQALRINPEMHEAVCNRGLVLATEARALVASDPVTARSLWQQAREKYQQALSINPKMHGAANNWGTALCDEAGALVASDLEAARKLWQQAGEKFQLVLSIEPDMHTAAKNWGTALASEARALLEESPELSQELLFQAEELLLAHAGTAPGEMAYNLACVYSLRGDVVQCLHWLKVSDAHKKLPDCEHIRDDKDLDAVRNLPEFIAWFATVCGSTGSPRTVKEDQR